MSSRLLLNLALVSIAIALALVIHFQLGIEPEPLPQPITNITDSNTISSIRIERTQREPLLFRKQDEQWQLQVNDHALPGSEFQLRSLLRLPQATSTANYAANTLDLTQLDLEPPQVTVSFDDQVIRLGDTNPLDNRRYAAVGDQVFLIEDNYQHLVNADWSNFVSRKLLPNNATITRLQLPDITLTLDDDNQQLLDYWQTVSALYVRRHDGGTGEIIRIETGDEAAPVIFHLLTRTPELVLARPDWGIQYHLAGSVTDNLLTPGEPKKDM